MPSTVSNLQSIEVLPTTTRESVNIVLPTYQSSNVDLLLSAGQLTAVVTPSSAFQILNHDYLPPVLAKPNAIVRPVRRDDPMNDQKLIAYVESQLVKHPVDEFTKELDKKLRRLKKDNVSKSSSKNGSNQETLSKRPLFITTVPKGVFLQPATEFRVPSRRIYAYSSKPRIFNNLHGHAKDKFHRVEKELLNAVSGVRAFANYISSHGGRETQPGEPYKNLMHEKRIVRGSNYNQSQTIAPWNPYFAYAGLLSGKGEGDCSKEAETRRRNLLRKRVSRNQRGVIGTPPPVCGRKHENVQTEKYLEELFEKPPEIEIGAQTDLFLQRPPSPPYIPAKIGVDAATEILEGDLFDFDTEVQPLLESLVGHSVEQGLVEILHEEEMADIKKQQQELLALRDADLAELRRLEAEELRLQAEKDRRLRQDEISKELDAEMQEKVTAAKLLQGHIANLVPAVLKQLEPLNEAENREELERKLCPWLTKQVAEEVGHMIDSREILTAIVREILLQRAEIYDPDYVPDSPDEKLVCEEEGDEDDTDIYTSEHIPTEDEVNVYDNNDGPPSYSPYTKVPLLEQPKQSESREAEENHESATGKGKSEEEPYESRQTEETDQIEDHQSKVTANQADAPDRQIEKQ